MRHSSADNADDEKSKLHLRGKDRSASKVDQNPEVPRARSPSRTTCWRTDASPHFRGVYGKAKKLSNSMGGGVKSIVRDPNDIRGGGESVQKEKKNCQFFYGSERKKGPQNTKISAKQISEMG